MKNYLPLLLCVIVTHITTAQVGIGNINPKAALDISASNPTTPSNTDGLLIPRIDNFPAIDPTEEQQGMIAYLTTTVGGNLPGFYYWNNTTTGWVNMDSDIKTYLEDTDADTKIQVEESADEDIIRFDLAGTERLRLDQGRMEFVNSNSNIFIGESTGESYSSGGNNVALGAYALQDFSNGVDNIAIGHSAFENATAISYNIGIGWRAGYYQTGGNKNVLLGYLAGAGAAGHSKFRNTMLGHQAGQLNEGDGNVFLGFNAGMNYTGSNKLFIDNTNTSSPLIYGEFGANLLRVNGTLDVNNEYQFPTVDGTAGQVLSTDGAGAIGWNNVTPGLFEVTSNVVQPNASVNDGTADFLFGAPTLDNDGNSNHENKLYFDKSKGSFRAGKGDGTYWNQGNTGEYSAAFGDGTRANGLSSMAWGYYSEAIGDYSTAGGISYALGDYSYTWGQAIAEGEYATAWGYLNTAWEDYSTAWGSHNESDGDYSTVWGSKNQAFGNYATVWGYEINSSSAFETIFGSFNRSIATNSSTSWNVADPLLAIGNGISDSNRSNALTIFKNGTMNINDAYNMPTSDGSNGQVMTTDGSGVVSWNTPVTGTDDQNIAGSGLSGTNLTIGIEGGTSQVINLATLQDGTGTDNQNISGSGLSGTNLTIGIEGGTSEIINLATLQDGTGTDDQNISGSGLSGTNLTIGIEGGTAQAIDVSSLQNGLFEVISGVVKPNNTVDLDTDDFVFGSSQLAGDGNSGHYRRFFFDKSKGAFRAGFSSGTNWDNVNVGNSSGAMGVNTIASGSASFAWGDTNTASAQRATAWGYSTIASGQHSTVWGYDNSSTGFASTAWGEDNNATARNATVWGRESTASGNSSTAWGSQSSATGVLSTAWGFNSTAPSAYETALGNYNTTYSPTTSVSWFATDRLFVIGNGTTSSNSDALIILKNGTITAPSLDISEITDDKALVTKEYVEVEAETTTIAFESTWGNYGLAYERVTYYKDRDRVYIDGLALKNTTITANDHIFTLPVGYRPQYRVMATGQQVGDVLRIEIHPDGKVYVRNFSGLSTVWYINLGGISFRVN